MKFLIERACARSLAMIMTVPTSPGPRYVRQSRKHAKNTAMTASTKDLPPRRPTTSHASCNGFVGGAARPVNRWNTASWIGVSSSPNKAVRNTRHAAQVLPWKWWPKTFGSWSAETMFMRRPQARCVGAHSRVDRLQLHVPDVRCPAFRTGDASVKSRDHTHRG